MQYFVTPFPITTNSLQKFWRENSKSFFQVCKKIYFKIASYCKKHRKAFHRII